jgi:hypothetical protein
MEVFYPIRFGDRLIGELPQPEFQLAARCVLYQGTASAVPRITEAVGFSLWPWFLRLVPGAKALPLCALPDRHG